MATQHPVKLDLSKYIEIRLFEDRPHIRGRRIPIAMIAYTAHGNKWDIAETAHQFSLKEAEVLAALLYYEEHRDLIDQQEVEEQAQFDQMKRLHGDG